MEKPAPIENNFFLLKNPTSEEGFSQQKDTKIISKNYRPLTNGGENLYE